MESEQATVLLKVLRVLGSLGIDCHVGGSVASSIHGIPRFTQDIDIVAEVRDEDIPGLVQSLEAEFYIDAGMIQDAIRRRASFNLIHLETLNKVDVFVPPSHPWAAAEASRRLMRPLQEGDDSTLIAISRRLALPAPLTIPHGHRRFAPGHQVYRSVGH